MIEYIATCIIRMFDLTVTIRKQQLYCIIENRKNLMLPAPYGFNEDDEYGFEEGMNYGFWNEEYRK